VQRRIPRAVEEVLLERASAFPGLAGRFVEVVDTWELRVTSLLEGGWNSLVALVEADADVAVLKLAAHPCALAREAVALAWWGDKVAPRVLRHDERLGALLMERLEPGSAIGWVGATDTADVLPLVAHVHRPLAGEVLALPLLSELGDKELQTMRAHARLGRHLVDAPGVDMAHDLLSRLFAPTEASEHVVLHGDLVPSNVLRAHDGLRVIDPRPAVGERAYDAAYWSIFSGYGRDARSNISLLARELRLDEPRVLAWTWALAVDRLLQIVDSAHPGHAALRAQLRRFIRDTLSEVAALDE